MPRIERTSRAKTDAVEIWAYIVEDTVTAADDLIDQIESRLAGLARMPESAEAVPYIAPDVRRSSVGNYVIYYRPIHHGIQAVSYTHLTLPTTPYV